MVKYMAGANSFEWPPGSETFYAPGDEIPDMDPKEHAQKMWDLQMRGHVFEPPVRMVREGEEVSDTGEEFIVTPTPTFAAVDRQPPPTVEHPELVTGLDVDPKKKAQLTAAGRPVPAVEEPPPLEERAEAQPAAESKTEPPAPKKGSTTSSR